MQALRKVEEGWNVFVGGRQHEPMRLDAEIYQDLHEPASVLSTLALKTRTSHLGIISATPPPWLVELIMKILRALPSTLAITGVRALAVSRRL